MLNTASGAYGTVPGGGANTAGADFSFAAGRRAQALHEGSFVWSDATHTDDTMPTHFVSTAVNQFLINATGGVGIGTNAPANLLHVSGAGTSAGGCCSSLEVVGHFIQPAAGQHSTLSVDAASGQDSILYFAEGGSAVWGLRNDSDTGDKFQLRYHGGGVGGDSVSRLTVLSGGNVGLGTSTPARKLHVSDAMRLQPIASPPASPASGDLYFDTSEALCVYVGGAWAKLAGPGTCN